MESYEKSRTWRAWQGTMEEFTRIAQAIEDVEKNRRSHLAAEGVEDVAWKYFTSGSEEFVRMTIVEKEEEFAGPLSEMLGQVDRRTIKGAQLETTGPYGQRINCAMPKHSRVGETGLNVQTHDPDTTRAGFTRLASEIEKGIPLWGRVPRPVLTLTLFGASCVVFALLIVVLQPHIHWKSDAWASLFWIMAITEAFLLYPEGRLMRFLFPFFEITGDGVSSGSRRALVIGGFLLTVTLEIVINLLT
jgi:hypothetical protein